MGQKKGEKKPPVLPSEELSRARTMAERGDTFFKLGEYEKALNEYKDAYLLSKTPLLLINIGQCYRALGKYEEAKHHYEAYLREDPEGPYAEDMRNKMAEMNTILEAKRKEAAKAPATPASLVVTVQTPTTEPPRVKPWMIGGGLGAMLLGGAAVTFLVVRNEEEAPQTALGGQFVF
jgi:tetratricopeptide (TPR) repeat protein